MDIKEKIIEYAKEIGIDLIGTVKAEVFKDIEEVLREREEKNFLSGFEEKDIEKRINPFLTFDRVKTIIVVGISYFVDEKAIDHMNQSKFYGEISKSSWGMDYHIALKKKMKSLSEYIKEEIPDFQYKCFVDTGPLVDRYLAFKAGIGWYGKNNCIISKEYGSWIFIGSILSNLDIEIENKQRLNCMNCNRCIDVCPTGALMDNYKYNTRLCISYLTQTKEDIDYSLREKMGKALYGCDICQTACPHNIDVLAGHRDFIPDRYNYRPDLLELLKLSRGQFKERFGKTSLGWRGNRIIKRNALIALGNSKEKELVKYLVEYLDSPSIMIRKYTAWAIIRLDKDKGKKILDKHLKKEKEREVIEEIKKLYRHYI